MKLTGKIILDKTPGRNDSWVKKQVEHDYFLTLQIIQIDEQPIKNIAEFFSYAWTKAPTILLSNEKMNSLFQAIASIPNTKDIPNIALGNFPDFRLNRSVECGIDQDKLTAARELEGTLISIDISDKDFELVVATKNQSLIDHLKQDELFKFEDGSASVETAPTIGLNRDAILNIKPSISAQMALAGLSKQVFGDNFELWNAVKQPVPYHLSLAQTNEMTKLIEAACKKLPVKEVVKENLSKLSI